MRLGSLLLLLHHLAQGLAHLLSQVGVLDKQPGWGDSALLPPLGPQLPPTQALGPQQPPAQALGPQQPPVLALGHPLVGDLAIVALEVSLNQAHHLAVPHPGMHLAQQHSKAAMRLGMQRSRAAMPLVAQHSREGMHLVAQHSRVVMLLGVLHPDLGVGLLAVGVHLGHLSSHLRKAAVLCGAFENRIDR